MYKILILTPLVLTAVASADVFDINASERGWVCSECGVGNNGASPTNNYLAGFVATSGHFRDWFEFDIPTLSGEAITSATLSLYAGVHVGGDLTFAVYGLSGQPTVLTDVTSADPFGSIGTNSTSSGTTVTITLNAAALAAIAADQGGSIFIGGIDSGESSPTSASDFGSTQDGTHFNGSACPNTGGSGHCATTLDLTTTSIVATPEPSSTLLLGAVLVILAGVLVRRHSAVRL